MADNRFDPLSFLGASRTKRWFKVPSMRVKPFTKKMRHYVVARQNPVLSPSMRASLVKSWKGAGWIGKK